MAKLFANSGDPDQTLRSVASDLGLHCLPITLLRVSRLQWVNHNYSCCVNFETYYTFFYFSEKIWLDMSCELKVWQNNKIINLTLKAPRKPASENVVCLCHLLNILANFSNLFLHIGKQCGPRSDCF